MKNSITTLSTCLALLGLLPLPTVVAQGVPTVTVVPEDQLPFRMGSERGTVDPHLIELGKKSNEAILRGQDLMKEGSLADAIVAFKEALSYESDNGLAQQYLAETYTADSKFIDAIAIYRRLFYHLSAGSTGNSQEANSTILMRFALVLLKTGQRVEAMKVYQQGYKFLPTDRGPLPPLFTTPDFATTDFQAAAYTAMGIYETAWGVADDAPQCFEHAIASQPGLAAPYYYRALKLKCQPGRAADALADFRRAERLGSPAVRSFVGEALKNGTTEFTQAVKKAQATP